MGLDIYAFESVRSPHKRDAVCSEAASRHVHAFVVHQHFAAALRGLQPDRCYLTAGRSMAFRAGSYSGYNEWRRELSYAALTVAPEAVWEDQEDFRDRPFFEIINFADNEGVLGPEACGVLAADFEDAAVRDRMPDWCGPLFDKWAAGFRLASPHGCVEFG